MAKTVVVGLNLPHGQVFRLFKNGQEVKRVTVKGNNAHLKGQEKGVNPVGGYGFTTIPAEDWAEIKKQYGNLPIFKSGLIFAADTEDKAKGEAAEKAGLRHGAEPIDTSKTATEEGKAE